jgi:hypothetical protein
MFYNQQKGNYWNQKDTIDLYKIYKVEITKKRK